MPRRIIGQEQLKSAVRRSPPAIRRAGLGPIGSSMIELIGASLVAKKGALVQPQPAIWSKL